MLQKITLQDTMMIMKQVQAASRIIWCIKMDILSKSLELLLMIGLLLPNTSYHQEEEKIPNQVKARDNENNAGGLSDPIYLVVDRSVGLVTYPKDQ